MSNTIIAITVNPSTVIVTQSAAIIFSTILPTSTPTITQSPQFFLDPNVQELIGIVISIITIALITAYAVIRRTKNLKRKILEHDVRKQNDNLAAQVQQIISE